MKKEQLEPDIEEQILFKLGKEYVKTVYCYSDYLTLLQSTLCETPGWMKVKLELRLSEEISATSDMQMALLEWQKAKRN